MKDSKAMIAEAGAYAKLEQLFRDIVKGWKQCG